MFVGGDRACERYRPVLDVLAGDVFDVGPNGAGTTVKLVVNALLGVGMQALAEALALGQHAGLDKELLLDALEGTSVLTPGYKYKLHNVRADSYPVEFALRLMWKDFWQSAAASSGAQRADAGYRGGAADLCDRGSERPRRGFLGGDSHHAGSRRTYSGDARRPIQSPKPTNAIER